MHETSRESWTLLTVYRALFRFKGRMIGFAVTVILLAVVGLLICPRAYESEAKLLLRVGRESVSLDPTATSTGQVIGLDRPLESEINSVIEVIKSRTILEKVLRSMPCKSKARNFPHMNHGENGGLPWDMRVGSC